MIDRDFNRRMLRTVLTVTAVALVLTVMYLARSAMILIYVSGLIAMGFSPLVRVIQRPQRGPHVPRTFAILVIYLTIVAVVVLLGMMVVPPLVDQATSLWAHL